MTYFQQFDTIHFLTIILILCLTFCSGWLGRHVKGSRHDRFIRWAMASVLAANEIGMHVVALYFGDWRIAWALPLHLCDLSLFALVIALIGNVQIAWELAYFWGLGGSIPTIFTPDLPLAFPHYSYVVFFIHHGGILIGVAYLIGAHAYSLTRDAIPRVWVITHVYVAFIALFNWVVGANYLFLCAKPSQPSIIDFLGPWPVYLLGLEVIFILILFILYWGYRRLGGDSRC